MSQLCKPLGFDFGLARIGVAVGQSITGTASPVTTVPAQDGEPSWQEIAKLVQSWRPTHLVVGIPYNTDGSESDMSSRARKFACTLEQFDIPVVTTDERYTTREARSILEETYGDRRGKAKVDALAACIIVEQFLKTIV